MTQPLNYTVKAIEALSSYPCPGAPLSRLGMRYVADKLRQAQVFVLGDAGQLLERNKPRPEVPGIVFKPPFPVVALEYSAADIDWDMGEYTQAKCPRRIALAWEWQDDLPPLLRGMCNPNLGEGVVILSIAYYEGANQWVPIAAGMHLAYDTEWRKDLPITPFRAAMIECGRLSKKTSDAATMQMAPIPIMPEVIFAAASMSGPDKAADAIAADNMDEVNAYTDLCYALACKNVTSKKHDASVALNKQRIKVGKLPLKDFHVLEVAGAEAPGGGDGSADRNGPRSHLRRGHIRRLAGDRVTWVNATMVRGQGFIDKVYSA